MASGEVMRCGKLVSTLSSPLLFMMNQSIPFWMPSRSIKASRWRAPWVETMYA